MVLRIVAGGAGQQLASAMASCLDVEPVSCSVERFPDGELRPGVGDLRGDDVYVVQPTGPPVNDNLVELLLILDACRRAGAERVTAVVPYYGYARQDRRDRAGDAIGGRVAAVVISAAGADRVLVVDPHTVALESMFGIGVETLTAVPVLVTALAGTLPDGVVVIAPDLGAVNRHPCAARRRCHRSPRRAAAATHRRRRHRPPTGPAATPAGRSLGRAAARRRHGPDARGGSLDELRPREQPGLR